MQKFFPILIVPVIMFFLSSSIVSATTDGAVTFSVSPPLFKVNMKPGETWSSYVKVINNNPYPVFVYGEVVNFKSSETGGVEFIGDSGGDYSKYMLNQWIMVDKKAIDLASFSSVDVPFSIKLPLDADPGGHYAAILLGNKPTDETSGSVIKFSSKIASLILVKVDGQINEQGDVTEFSSEQSIYSNLKANLRVKFKNQGNVHIHPEGQIKISNMFGEERGIIEINKSQNFGNVLPESEKKWDFSWQGSNSILDAGPMKAELVLNYGDQGKQTVYRTLRFWSVNLRPTLYVVGSMLVVIIMVVLLIRFYIRRSVEKMKEQMGYAKTKSYAGKKNSKTTKIGPNKLTKKSTNISNDSMVLKILNWTLLKKSLILSIIFVVLLLCLTVYTHYHKYGFFDDEYLSDGVELDISTSSTAVNIIDNSTSTATSSENPNVKSVVLNKKEIQIINGSGQRDLGEKIRGLLVANNLVVSSVSLADVVYEDVSVVIKFNPGQLEDAQLLDSLLNNQAEIRQEETVGGQLIILLGNKFN